MTDLENIQKITKDKAVLDDLLDEIETAFYDIPFGNTRFQQENFVFASSITPQRAYRTLGLTLHGLLTALRDHQFALIETQIEVDEVLHKLQDPTLDQFEKRRLELKHLKITQKDTWQKKMLNDTFQELSFYYEKFKAFPKFTREEFEQGEKTYFEQSLRRQLVGLTGTQEALITMTEEVQTMQNFETFAKSLTDETARQNLVEAAIRSLAGPIVLKENNEE
jgi:hypothetical protein